jgi:hypothetical protein
MNNSIINNSNIELNESKNHHSVGLMNKIK